MGRHRASGASLASRLPAPPPARREGASASEPPIATRETLLGPGDRLLVVAPHPDDETLATGGLLQRALAVGVPARVVFITDGDNNPWAQRAFERRLRVGPADRARFGARRRREALDALARLGYDPACARFLGEPDQGLTGLLLRAPGGAVAALRREIDDWRPTVLAGPSPADLHPDHSAAAALLALAFHPGPDGRPAPRCLCYTIHNPDLRSRPEATVALALAPEEVRRKSEAIACHHTQAILRGPWLRSFAAAAERFHAAGAPEPFLSHPVSLEPVESGGVRLRVAGRPRPRAFGATTLHLVVSTPGGTYRSLSLVPARPGRPPAALDLLTGAAVPLSVRPLGGAVEVVLGPTVLPAGSLLLVKLARRWGFFDEAGWRAFVVPRQGPEGLH